VKKILLLLLFCLTLYADPVPFSDKIEQQIKERFLSAHPNMQIDKITLKLLSPLPKGAPISYESVILPKAALKRAKGNFTLVIRRKGRIRKLYGSYILAATIPVYKSTRKIPANALLDEGMVTATKIPFTYLYKEPIDASAIGHYRLKHSVKPGKILMLCDLKSDFAVNRNDNVTASLQEGGLRITFRAKALQNGTIGDIIKIKKGYNTLLKARVIVKGEVEVIE